jgi:hypothetical protein
MVSPLCCIQVSQSDCAAHLLNICLRGLRLKQRPTSVRRIRCNLKPMSELPVGLNLDQRGKLEENARRPRPAQSESFLCHQTGRWRHLCGVSEGVGELNILSGAIFRGSGTIGLLGGKSRMQNIWNGRNPARRMGPAPLALSLSRTTLLSISQGFATSMRLATERASIAPWPPCSGKMSRLSCRIIFDNCPQPLGDFRSAPQFSHLAITAPPARSRGLHSFGVRWLDTALDVWISGNSLPSKKAARRP